MAGELGRWQATTFMYRDGLGADVNMSPDDEMVIPGLDPDAGVEGGVDPSKDDDNCTGGACKI